MPQPLPSHESGYSFEYPVKVPGSTITNFLDLYRRAFDTRITPHAVSMTARLNFAA